MQQHLMQMQMQPMVAAYYPNNVTTDHIQQYLDENKSLILKIVESQNSGKLNECAENQARLQQNLMYLAAIADSHPQPPAVHSQFPSSGIMQPGGGHYMPHQQAQPMTQQSLMASRASALYAQQPFSAVHSQVGLSSAGGSGALAGRGFPDFVRVSSAEGMHGGGSRAMAGGTGSKQDSGSAVGSPEDQCDDEN
ncbi:hypothetical protein GQ457_11G015300 [Hibiscus cannabinus]